MKSIITILLLINTTLSPKEKSKKDRQFALSVISLGIAIRACADNSQSIPLAYDDKNEKWIEVDCSKIDNYEPSKRFTDELETVLAWEGSRLK